MSTSWTTEKLNDYLDDRLSLLQRSELQAAIQADPAARHALNELRLLRREIRKLPRFAPPASLAPAVVSRIQQECGRPDCELASDLQAAEPASILASRFQSRDFRTAAIAIASLAASLLLALFAGPRTSETRVADRTGDVEAPIPDHENGIAKDDAELPGGVVLPSDFLIGNDRQANKTPGDSGALRPSDSSVVADHENADSPASDGAIDSSLTVAAESVQRVLDEPGMVTSDSAEPGDVTRFDDVIVLKASPADIQRILAQLNLAPSVEPAQPDSYDSPSGSVFPRKAGTLEDKSRPRESGDFSVPDEATSSSEPVAERLIPQTAYVSVQGTMEQIDEILGGLGTSLHRVPASPAGDSLPPGAEADGNAETPGNTAEGASKPVDMYRLGEGERWPAATATRKTERKRVLLIFEKVATPEPAREGR